MTLRFFAPALAALSLICAGTAVAQPAAGGGGTSLREACMADFQKYCASAPADGRMQCMKDHTSQLSDTCKAAIAARMKERQSQPAGQGGS